MACDPKLLNVLLKKRRAELTAAGKSESEITVDLAHLQKMLTDSDSYALATAEARGIEPGLNTAETAEFDNLKAAVFTGFGLGKTTIEEILGESGSLRFKELLVRRQVAGKAKKVEPFAPRERLLERLDAEIERLSEAGNIEKADKLRQLRKKLQELSDLNSKRGKSYDKIRELREQVDKLTDDLKAVRLLLDDVPETAGLRKAIEAEQKKLKSLMDEKRKLGKELTNINNKIEKADSKAEKAKLKKEAAALTKKMNKLDAQISKARNRIRELSSKRGEKERSHPAKKAEAKLRAKLLELSREMSKYGVNSGLILKTLVENSPATARQIQEALERVNNSINFKEQTIEKYFEENDSMEPTVLGHILGTEWVLKRTRDKKTLTRAEVNELMNEYAASAVYAGAADGEFIAEMEFADADSLAELEALSDAEARGALIDDSTGDEPIVRSLTKTAEVENSNPGVIPESNRLKEGVELYKALRRLLFKVETLRRLQQFGKFASSDLMWVAIRDIAELNDVNPEILFKDAIQYEDGRSLPANVSHSDLINTAKQLLVELGLDVEVLNLPEFTEPARWLMTSESISLDIETHVDGTAGVHTLVLMDSTDINNPDSIRTTVDINTMSSEQIMSILYEVEQKQNAGAKLYTYNGNNFDLLTLANLVGTDEAYRLAARIMLRSVDLMQNITAFGARTETDMDLLNRTFKLSNVAEALKTDLDKTYESYMPSLWKKRSTGVVVSTSDLSIVSSLTEADKQSIVDQVNLLIPDEANNLLVMYLVVDGRLNIQVGDKLLESQGRSISVKHSSGANYNIVIGELKPTWAMDLTLNHHYNGRNDAMSEWNTTEVGQVVSNVFDATLPKNHYGRVVFDLDKVQAKLMTAMAIALTTDPNTKAFGKAIMDVSEQAITKEEQAALTAINIIQANQKAAKALNEKAFVDNGSRLPLSFRGTKETGGIIPGYLFAEGTETEQAAQYIAAVADGMAKQIEERRASLEDIVERAGFRERLSTESKETYLIELAKHAIKKFTSHKDINLIDFGNGKIDFAPGHSVGRGIVQLLNRDMQGFRKSMSVESARRLGDINTTADAISSAAANATNPVTLSQIYRLPVLSEVNNVFPRSLAQIERAYTDFRVRQRIAHILNYDIKTEEDARAIIDLYMDQEENPDEVLANTSSELLNLVPNVNNRRMFNNLPTLESHRELTIEALLDMPELLVMWQHDSMTWARGMELFLDESTKQRLYSEDAFSPGSLTATALLSGIGPQFAHVLTYPKLGKGLVYKSLERGIQAAKEGARYSASNYFDFNMNGAHHFAALWLHYSDTQTSTLDRLLEEAGLADVAQDRYQKAADLLEENISEIIKHYEAAGDAEGLRQAKALETFLREQPKESRDALKQAVVARLYMAGIVAVRDNIRSWMYEQDVDFGFTADFLAEHILNQKTFLTLNILDTALGQTDKRVRVELATKLENALAGVYGSSGWHVKLKEIAQRNGFDSAGRRMFGLNEVYDAIEQRLTFMSQLTNKPIEELKARYADRIEKANKYVESVGTISSSEQMKTLNTILMGNEQAYRNLPTLAGINILQRTPYALRTEMINEHADLLGVHLEESDLMGFENFNIFFPVGQDSSGMRLYMIGHRHQPQNSSGSSVVREGTPEGKDDNRYAMWDFGRNRLAALPREKQEVEITKLIAKHIALKLARNYAPKFGDYNVDASESRTNFMTEWQRRSELEDNAYARQRSQEATLTPEQRKFRSKNGTLLSNSARFLLDPTRSYEDASVARYNPGAESNLKGIGAFRPEYGAMPWQERGIFGLMEMDYNLRTQAIRQTRVQRPDADFENVNEVLPSESRGFANPYQDSKAPYIYETAFDSTHDMVYGNSSNRIEMRAAALKTTLEKFAVKNGLLNLVEEGNWAKLYTTYKVHRAVVHPYLHGLSRLAQQEEGVFAERELKKAQELRLNMLSDLTSLWRFHDDVSKHSRSYLEFGEMIGIDGRQLKGKQYIDLLFTLAQMGITNLKPLRLGLSPTNNLLATGEPAADQRGTRTITLTVQSADSLQVIFNLLYHETGRQIATNYLKKVAPDKFDSFEKDSNGFVLLSAVPAEHMKPILDRIFDSGRFDTTAEMELYLFLDDFGSAVIGNKTDYQNYMDRSSGKVAKPRPGGLPRFDTSQVKANAIYHLSPEDIGNMFNQLQNQVFFATAELATMLGSEVGVATNDNVKFLNEERRKYFEMQRLAYADEMDVLAHLHQQSNTEMKTTNNIKMTDEFGLPLTVYDAAHYVAGKDGLASPLTLAFQGYINNAIYYADIYGLREEVRTLQTLNQLSFDNKYIIPATLILAQASDTKVSSNLRRLKAYVGNELTDAEVAILYRNAKEFAHAYLAATTRETIRNQYYNPAKRYVELNGPVNALNPSPEMYAYVGITEDSSESDRREARQAFEKANGEYDPGYLLSDEEITEMSEEDGFIDAFNVRGAKLNLAIKNLVDTNAITEETAFLYRGMIGAILSHNEDFATQLSIELDSTMDRAGSSQRYGDRFVIKLNPDLLKRRAVPEALEVMAHELSHIARLRHMETDGATYNGVLAAFKTNAGQTAMREMITALFSGDQGEINSLLDHYSDNPEEFMAEWGAFVLIAKVVNNKSLMADVAAIRSKHDVAETAAHWWEQAFNRIKNFANKVSQRMTAFRSANPEAMQLLDNAIEVMFNFGNTYSNSRGAVENTSAIFGYPLRELNKGSALTAERQIVTLDENIKELSRLEQKGDTLTTEEVTRQNELTTILAPYRDGNMSLTMLGNNAFAYIQTIARLMENTTEGYRLMKRPETKEEQIAVATFVLERAAQIRGRRGGQVEEARGLLASLSGLTDNKVKEHIVDVLYNGVARSPDVSKKGWGGGSTASLTYASSDSILAALGFLLDSTKGSGQNLYGGKVGGILENFNYMQQWSRTVIMASEAIRNKYRRQEAIQVEKAAYYYLVLGEPANQADLPNGGLITTEMFNDAKQYAKIYKKNTANYVALGKKYQIFNKDFLEPNDLIGLRVSNSWLDTADGDRTRIFVGALNKVYRNKIFENIRLDGKADNITLYLSNALPQVVDRNASKNERVTAVKRFYNSLITRTEMSTARQAILEELEQRAFMLFAGSEESNAYADKIVAFNIKKSSPNTSSFDTVAPFIYQATEQMLREAKQGSTYETIFKNIVDVDNNKKLAILDLMRSTLDNGSRSDTSRIQDILTGRNSVVFTNLGRRPVYLNKVKDLRVITPGEVHTQVMLLRQGHNTVMPNVMSNDLTAADLQSGLEFLSENEKRVLNAGFSKDLRSIVVGIERAYGRSAYNRKAIQDLTGVPDMSFSALIQAIKDSKNSNDWNVVLDKIKHKHDLAVGAATVVDESQGSGALNLLAKSGVVATDVLWGPNQNMANLINESVIGSIVNVMYGGNQLSFFSDIAKNTATLFVNVFSRSLGNKLMNRARFQAIEDALFDMDAATRSVVEHNLIDYDEADPMINDEKNFAKRFVNGWYRRLKDGNRTASIGLRQALRLQGQRHLLLRASKLQAYLDAVNNYSGPRNVSMWKNIVREVGSSRMLGAMGMEGMLIRMMWESGVLDSTNIKAINYILDKFGTDNVGIMGRKILNLTKIKRHLELSIDGGHDLNLYDALPDGDGLLKNDIYEALAAISRFQTKYAQQTIVESNVLDRNTENTGAGFLMNLYRSFPKLFVTQHVLESYGRVTPALLAAKLTTATIMDIVYNIGLMYIAGILSYKDLERFAEGDFKKDDMATLLLVLSRNPLISARLAPAVAAQFTALMVGEAFKDQPNITQALNKARTLGLPPAVIAMTSGLYNLGTTAYDAINMDGEFDEKKAFDLGSRLVPGFDVLMRHGVSSALGLESDKQKSNRGSRSNRGSQSQRGEMFSPYTLMNDNTETPYHNDNEILKQILKESIPQGVTRYYDRMEELNLISPPDIYGTPPQQTPSGQSQPAQPQQTPDVPQPRQQPDITPRMTTPAKPPQGL